MRISHAQLSVCVGGAQLEFTLFEVISNSRRAIYTQLQAYKKIIWKPIVKSDYVMSLLVRLFTVPNY